MVPPSSSSSSLFSPIEMLMHCVCVHNKKLIKLLNFCWWRGDVASVNSIGVAGDDDDSGSRFVIVSARPIEKIVNAV